MAAAGVNFIDVYQREGDLPRADALRRGQRGCRRRRRRRRRGRGSRRGRPGRLATGSRERRAVCRLPASAVVVVPEAVDLETAAAVMLQGLTAHYLTTSTYAVRPGDVALVHAAAGGVGQLLVQIGAGAGGHGRRDGRGAGQVRDGIRARCRTRHRLPGRRRPRGRGAAADRRAAGSTSRTTASARTPSTRHWRPCDPGGCSRSSGRPAGRCRPSTSSGSTPVVRCSSPGPRSATTSRPARSCEWRAGEVLGAVADGQPPRGDRRALPARRGRRRLRRPRGPAHRGQAPPPPVRRHAGPPRGRGWGQRQRTAMAVLSRASAPAALTSCGRAPRALALLGRGDLGAGHDGDRDEQLDADLGVVHLVVVGL